MRLPSFRRLATTTSSTLLSSRFYNCATMTSSAASASIAESSSSSSYVPPKVWTWEAKDDNKWASLNRPTAGARFEKELSVGKHPLQLYSLATPNGQKVTILLEELLATGLKDAEYDAWLIRITEQDQFGSGFTAINPNSKIPAMSDRSIEPPASVFESGSILLYLAEKFEDRHPFLPADKRTAVLNWLFWQMGAAPYLGGGFGHFFTYAAEKQEYPINRFTMEIKRQLDVLNNQLATNKYLVGDEYTVADMAVFPWYGSLVLGKSYPDAHVFLNVAADCPHVIRWAKEISARPAVQRGLVVNKAWGDGARLPERHDADDITQALATAAQEKKETE